MAVDGGAGNAEQVGDLLDGVLASVVELLGVPGLGGAESGAAAAGAATGAGGRERTEDLQERPLAVFAWLADWYGRDGERGCAFLNVAADPTDPTDPARVVIAREKRWLVGYLVELARGAGPA